MSEKKVLLELRGVKTFFPVRGGFFNKVRDHVQAVNNVDLDIYKGAVSYTHLTLPTILLV